MWLQVPQLGHQGSEYRVSWLFTLGPDTGTITVSRPFSRSISQIAGPASPRKHKRFLVHWLPMSCDCSLPWLACDSSLLH